MLGSIKTLLGRLHTGAADGGADGWPQAHTPVSEDSGRPEDPATDDSAAAQSPHLYNCSSCDRIYVATDKRTCATCNTAVDRVEQTS
ncbi:hypothetical protein [Natronomonas gomsonensis]|uniref:hypothetical protein n=1 Tax=Natronomonas gomsonensis TaxID=1046043 RepID=UPI0015BEE4C2|nr:hypothetical protein [Natronomonas gomsonensis]